MIRKIIDFFKKRPGLTILIVILSFITFVNIKPDFYLLGWDNYSSYFNLKTNIFRTFFATWREYRGLGVASDAEATDVFRQIFYWITSFILPENLLDQVYYMMALWIGVLSMYFLSKLLYKEFLSADKKLIFKYSELFALVSSLIYLFNLNTLSVFYSPIIPFTNRFYSLPLTIYFFIRFLASKKRRDFLWLVLMIIFTSGSYITPTLIITTFFALITFLYFWTGLKKTLIYSIIFLLLNSFWFLPFINYTLKKSPIIPLARTFIEINESTLNQSKSDFSLYKQAIMYPSFFNIKFPSLSGNDQLVHSLLAEFQKPINRNTFLVFPILYSIGGLLVFYLATKKNKKLLWLPLWVIFFLFISTKQYGPLGFLYSFLDKNIPYFGIIFRIGDTKFHAYINMAGSLLSAYAIIRLFLFIQKNKFFSFLTPVLIFILIYYVYLFRSYFTGDMINYILYVKIPKVYFEVAKIINKDKENVRVLHLPFDNWHHYWRSYSWGYLGSSFYNFFLDKPYIDKTFEPGSMENSYLHSKINTLITGFYRSEDDQDKEKNALRLFDLLAKTGTKYVILDDSISSSVYPKNINYTARQSFVSSKEIMDYLNEMGLVTKNDFNYFFDDFFSDYEELYPIKQIGFTSDLPLSMTLSLYELKTYKPHLSFVDNVIFFDNYLDNLLETDIDILEDKTIIQRDTDGVIYPFIKQNHKVRVDNNSINLDFPNNLSEDIADYEISNERENYHSIMIDVYGQVEGQNLNLDFYHRYYPDINGKVFQKFMDSVSFKIPDNPKTDLSNYRLMIDGVVISIPQEIVLGKKHVNSVIVHDNDLNIDLLVKKHDFNVDINSFENKTTISNCQIIKQNDSFKIDLCNEPMFVDSTLELPESGFDKQFYFEANFVLKGESSDRLSEEKLTHSYICISQNDQNNCLNLHRNLIVNNEFNRFDLKGDMLISSQFPINIQVGSIPFDDYSQSLEIRQINIPLFEKVDSSQIKYTYITSSEKIDLKDKLTLSFPKAVSNNSFYFDRGFDFYDKTTAQCGGEDVKRVSRFEKGVFVNSMESCLMALAQIFNYYYRSPYLLIYDYWLGSGQQPLFSLKKKTEDHLVERASLYQGYPKIAGMKGDTINLTTASRIIEPNYYSDTSVSKVEVNFFQDTINQGSFALGGLNMVEIPSSWYGIKLMPFDSIKQYFVPEITYSETSILPSLWRVDLEDFNPQNRPSLLYFREGFDRDWGLYKDLFSVLIGEPIVNSSRCDGFANCFEVQNISSKNRYYIFYWPERLYLLGWFLTVLTIIFSLKILSKEPLKTE